MKSLVFYLAFLVPFCLKSQDNYDYRVPVKLNDGWPVKNIHESKLKAGPVISSMGSFIVRGHYNPDSYLIIKDDSLVFEEYSLQYNLEKQHDLRSVTKSIIALLVGIAIEQGLFSLEDPVQDHLIELQNSKIPDSRKSQILIRHLLTMSSGLDCNDWNKESKGQEDRIYRKKDWIQALADLPMVHNPGEVSAYCTGGVMMLATIIERNSGMSLPEFAKNHLFSHLTINDLSWGHTNKKKVISAGQRLYMRPRDMAKLGLLILHKGKWKGKQIIPENWIDMLQTTQTSINGMAYSFWWWQITFPNNGQSITATVATGNGGQYIMCFPEHEMVVVFTGSAFNSPEQQKPFGIVNRFILPALH